MKKIILSFIAVMATMSISAQTVNVYKGDALVNSYTNSTSDKYRVELTKSASVPSGSTGTAKAKILAKYNKEYDVQWVQLWANGPKWAVFNVGATSISDYGGLYVWGTTVDHGIGAGGNYYYPEATYDIQGSTYDTAKKLWGNNWMMPTADDLRNLFSTDYTDGGVWKDSYLGRSGYLITGKGDYAQNYIFLPADGGWDTDQDAGSECYLDKPDYDVSYWSSTMVEGDDPDNDAYLIWATPENKNYNDYSDCKYYANSVRAILDVSASDPVEVVPVTGITLNATTAEIYIAGTTTLTTTLNPDNATNAIKWTSSDESVATVDASGVVTGVGAGTATITATATYGTGVTATCTVTVKEHEYVDLGLASGTLWAKCNIGATSVTDAGLYFAWGETTGYSATDEHFFFWNYYKWMTSGQSSWGYCTKYTFEDDQTSYCWYSNGTYVGTTVDGKTYKNLTKLESSDDAATANWGSDWCMPSKDQIDELLTKCSWTWDSTNKGYKVTGTNGNYIFLPAAGWRCDDGLADAGSYGYYWSSELSSGYSQSVCNLVFSSKVKDTSTEYRCYGFSVRPVRSK